MMTSDLDDHPLNEQDGRAGSDSVPDASIFFAFTDVHSEDGAVIR
ncbi:hypothetical protein [Variovorax guangxiensis]|uniref:Uncharacterized protein n=1 Tax=Variovorax guangxiensis TaxID=1775474 RepID=A0A840G2K5_9BURK|nr:hypothetical protein [Variovorax guangxiensis]MBB4226030.1 hypothetical protein [Variovorax guangxiensis]